MIRWSHVTVTPSSRFELSYSDAANPSLDKL
jgi:hypothetical protein